MRSSRIAVVLATTGLAVAASFAEAAPSKSPQLKDPTGDEKGFGAAYDIVSGQLTTTGLTTVKKLGKRKVTTYKPKNLVATLTLAAPPSSTPGSKYSFVAFTKSCDSQDGLGLAHPGYFLFTYAPLNAAKPGDLFTRGCGSDGVGSQQTWAGVKPAVTGNAITWTIALSELPSHQISLSTVFHRFIASTDLSDPALAIGYDSINRDDTFGTTGMHGVGSFDSAIADVSWKIG